MPDRWRSATAVQLGRDEVERPARTRDDALGADDDAGDVPRAGVGQERVHGHPFRRTRRARSRTSASTSGASGCVTVEHLVAAHLLAYEQWVSWPWVASDRSIL